MLHLLTDEHISPVVATQAVRKCPGIKINAIHQWRSGEFLGSIDRVWIPEAVADGLTLVTYDQKTIRPLLKDWVERNITHRGVVFVDEKSIVPQDFGGLVKALCHLWRLERHADWTNRVIF